MNKRKGLSIALMIFGALLLAAALGLTALNQIEDHRACSTAASALEKLSQTAHENSANNKDTVPMLPFANGDMKTIEIDSHIFIGYLSFPSLQLELPVQKNWDYNLLDYSPCRYYGSLYTGDLVIAAHNYQSHFGHLDDLNIGDEVIFISVDGIRYSYRVCVLETVSGDDVGTMLAGGYALTLYTCTLSGRDRLTVRCERI